MPKKTEGKEISSGVQTSREVDVELSALLHFERLLSDLSAAFVNLPSEQVDQEIEHWMGRIGKFLDMKVGTLAQHSEDQERARFTHTWAIDGIEKLPARPSATSYPWTFNQIRNGNIVQFTNVEELPEEAETRQTAFQGSGIYFQHFDTVVSRRDGCWGAKF